MSDLLSYSDEEFFAAIRAHGSLDVVIVARGRNEDAVRAALHDAAERRPKGEAGRFYMGGLPRGLVEAEFAEAVLEAVAALDWNIDGEVAGEYRIAA